MTTTYTPEPVGATNTVPDVRPNVSVVYPNAGRPRVPSSMYVFTSEPQEFTAGAIPTIGASSVG